MNLTPEQRELRESLHSLVNHPGWQEVYARGTDRMIRAQTVTMSESTNHEKRAHEVAAWNAVRDIIEWPQREIDYINSIEDRSDSA